jgi:hypothetical protein
MQTSLDPIGSAAMQSAQPSAPFHITQEGLNAVDAAIPIVTFCVR